MNEILVSRLKEKRDKAKLTQKQVADMLGLTQSAYAYYETGKNQPDIETLKRIADMYEISMDWLVGRF